MKNILILLLLSCSTAFSQITTKLEVECLTRKELAEILTEHSEVPFAIGTTLRIDSKGAEEGFMILFINPKTQTWTIVEKTSKNYYCILTAGSDFNLVTKSTPIKSF